MFKDIREKRSSMSYLILVLLWVLFYFFHSVFASLNIKRKFKAVMGRYYIWYRLLYSIFATFHFLLIFVYSATLIEQRMLNQSPLFTYIGYMLAGLGTIILVKSFKHFSNLKFVGLTLHDDLKEKEKLITKGIHEYIRHPIYTGLILIFLGYFFYQPSPSSMVHFIMLLAYLPFGIHFEEKKLIATYGEDYRKYKKAVPSLFPFKLKKTA
ncbi:methyltransferase family protein [Aquiflexum balticum]|nr:isoprenylcysteine carboxylmethyltransferase family protein [Aquiflexum balticum]